MSGHKGKRLITFGCSYTRYVTATWADYMGANFESYMNYGDGGASNTFIMNRFIEVNSNLNINESDYVVINKTAWIHGGNIFFNPDIPDVFIKTMWSNEWAVYQSYIAFKTIKEILTLKGIKHTILSSMNNNLMEEEFKDNVLISKYLKYMKNPI